MKKLKSMAGAFRDLHLLDDYMEMESEDEKAEREHDKMYDEIFKAAEARKREQAQNKSKVSKKISSY